MTPTGIDNELQRRLELLAGSALGDLTSEEHTDVEELLKDPSWQSELWQLELVVAAVDLRHRPVESASGSIMPLPKKLAQAIHSDAAKFFESAPKSALGLTAPSPMVSTEMPADGESSNVIGFEHSEDTKAIETTQLETNKEGSAEARLPVNWSWYAVNTREWLGWLACAACLLLAVSLWNGSEEVSLSYADQRESLIGSAEDIIQIEWSAGKTPFPENVAGDVVWSTQRQSGFMRFRGMPVNDAALEQYQLWIIDPARDVNPIDGGVFNVAGTGEIIVPIDAKLTVIAPQAFAITIEKPGGVVVSDQSRLPLLAAVP